MDAAIRIAISTCSGDDLHVVVIDGIDLNSGTNAGFQEIGVRRSILAQYAADIKKELRENKVNVVLHEYSTLSEAIADGHNLDFEVIFVSDHDQNQCEGYPANISALNAGRDAIGKPPATIVTVPTVYEAGGQVLSSTKLRKRENQGI
jgi:phosphopantetheine adenylyltransferase